MRLARDTCAECDDLLVPSRPYSPTRAEILFTETLPKLLVADDLPHEVATSSFPAMGLGAQSSGRSFVVVVRGRGVDGRVRDLDNFLRGMFSRNPYVTVASGSYRLNGKQVRGVSLLVQDGGEAARIAEAERAVGAR